MKILFFHGWQSVLGGIKPTLLAQHGHKVFNPQLPNADFAEAVRIAHAEFDKHQRLVIVGSSRGGAVAVIINSGDAKLVLLCPAWKKYGTTSKVTLGTVIWRRFSATWHSVTLAREKSKAKKETPL